MSVCTVMLSVSGRVDVVPGIRWDTGIIRGTSPSSLRDRGWAGSRMFRSFLLTL